MASVSIPATTVAWGLTVLNGTPNQENAIAFVNLLLGPVGATAFNAHGPSPISPALVSAIDYARLPKSIQSLVKSGSLP